MIISSSHDCLTQKVMGYQISVIIQIGVEIGRSFKDPSHMGIIEGKA